MNKCIISGNITKELELKQTNGGKYYLKFTIASRRDKDNTDFVNCVAWEKRAETIAQHFKKGDQIMVSGSFRTDSYDGQNGKVYSSYILLEEFEFGRKSEQKQNVQQPKPQQTNLIDAEPLSYNPIELESDHMPWY